MNRKLLSQIIIEVNDVIINFYLKLRNLCMSCGLLCLPLFHVVVLITTCNFQVFIKKKKKNCNFQVWILVYKFHRSFLKRIVFVMCFLGKSSFYVAKDMHDVLLHFFLLLMFAVSLMCLLSNISIMKTILVLLCIL